MVNSWTRAKKSRDLARRYAYAVYLQRRIPINTAEGQTGYTPLDPEKFHLLFPGNDEVMDMICDRIMNGGDYILDEDMIGRYSFLYETL